MAAISFGVCNSQNGNKVIYIVADGTKYIGSRKIAKYMREHNEDSLEEPICNLIRETYSDEFAESAISDIKNRNDNYAVAVLVDGEEELQIIGEFYMTHAEATYHKYNTHASEDGYTSHLRVIRVPDKLTCPNCGGDATYDGCDYWCYDCNSPVTLTTWDV